MADVAGNFEKVKRENHKDTKITKKTKKVFVSFVSLWFLVMELNYKSYGEGHPLIILHGLFGSLDNWYTLGKRFGEFFKVFALDQRNHGRSPHSDTFNYPVMAEDLKEFMLNQDISSAYLLGHSMGGKTAMQFAVTYPEKVDKLIVVDIAPRPYPSQHSEIFDALYSLDLSAGNRNEIDEALAERVPVSSVRQFLLKNLTRDDSGSFKWKMNLDGIYKNYDEINRGLETDLRFVKPALFIRGGNSQYIQQEDTTIIKNIFPEAKIATVAGAGHWIHAEAPNELFRLVIDFLND
jgi:esterase